MKAESQTTGRFEILEKLGEGGLGSVWRAYDRFAKRPVALKRWTAAVPEDLLHSTLHQEVRLLSRLSHPNLVSIYDYFPGSEDPEGRPFFTMECLEGAPLDAAQALSTDNFLRFLSELLSALHYLHGRRVLHRDLKPSNLFLTKDGTLKVLDFGLATLRGENPGAAQGTLAYLAPEAFWGDYGPASDLFSIGVLSYELLTGKLPYDRVLSGRLDQVPAPKPLLELRPDLPDPLADLLDRMMQLSPQRRPSSALAAWRYLLRHSAAPSLLPETKATELSLAKIPLVGRRSELQEAIRYLSSPEKAGLRILAVSGPTGVGRSRILEELRWDLQLGGREYRAWSPEAAEKDFAGSSPFALAREWKRLAGQGASTLSLIDLQLWSSAALRSLQETLALSRQCPGELSLVLEWNEEHGNEALSEFLKFLEGWPERLSLRLGDLTPSEAAEFLQAAGDEARVFNTPAETILAKAGGRPMLLIEALLHPEKSEVPKNFSAAARWRIQALSETTCALFALLTVHPDPVAIETLLTLSGLEEAAFDRSRLDLQSLCLIATDSRKGTLALSHPSLRSSYLEALPTEQIQKAHRSWIHSLQQALPKAGGLSPLFPLLADHARVLGDPRWEWEISAAEYVEKRGQEAEAERRYRNLLPLADSDEKKVLLYAHLAHLNYLLGRYDASLADYDAWIRYRVDDATGLQRAKHRFYTGLVLKGAGRNEEARARLEECLAVADAELHAAHRPYQARAHSLLAGLEEELGHRTAAQQHLKAGLALAEEDLALRGEMERRRGDFAAKQMDYSLALICYESAREAYQRCGDIQSEAIVLQASGMVLREQGKLREAQPLLEASLQAAERGGEVLQWARYTQNLALLAIDCGDYGRAEALQGEAASILHYWGTEEDRRLFEAHAAVLRMLCGDFSGARQSFLKLEAIPEVRGLAAYLLGDLSYLARDDAAAENFYRRSAETQGTAPRLALQAQIGAAKARWRRGESSDPKEALANLEQALAKLEGPWFRAWETALRWFRNGPQSFGEEEFLGFLALLRDYGSPELRLDLYGLLHRSLLRAGMNRMAAKILDTLRREWRGLHDSLREDLRMDFEKKRGLADLEKRLDALLPQEQARPSDQGPRRELGISEARFRQYTAINRQIAQKNELGEVLERVMDAAIELTGAERGFLLLQEGSGRKGPLPGFEVRTARGINQRSLESEEFQISRSAVQQTLETGAALLTDNAQLDSRFQEKKSVMQYQLQSILVVPLELEGKILGVLYLDHRYQTKRFSEEDLILLSAFAAQAALALDKARLISELKTAQERLQGQVATQAERIEALTGQLAQVRDDLKYEYREIIGVSPPMMRVFDLLDHVTETTIPVWIFGESGTGKELIAHSLHYNSPRKKGPFVTENVSAIPETLLESELFGHKRGAFTHADRDRVGLFEQASGGTLFLDEVADMSLALQAKLLRVLQEGEIRPLGSNKKVKVDVRLVTASNRDLSQLVREEKFRQDLFFRLNGMTIRLPPLRERKEDIPLLAEHLIQKIARNFNLKPSELSDEAFQALIAHSWPGNIRELEGVLRNALLFAKGRTITPEFLSLTPRSKEEPASLDFSESQGARAEEASAERQLILEALRRHRMDKAKVAEELKISLRTLYTRMEKLRIPKKRTVLAKYLGMS